MTQSNPTTYVFEFICPLRTQFSLYVIRNHASLCFLQSSTCFDCLFHLFRMLVVIMFLIRARSLINVVFVAKMALHVNEIKAS